MKERYIIELDRPVNCSVALMREYIKTAVRNWVGGSDPEHPLYNSFDDVASVKVARVDTAALRRHVQTLVEE